MLEIEGLCSGYGESLVLRSVSLTVEPGQVVCLMGRNGVGKTTLMKSIMGLLRSKNGVIRYNGADITRLPPDKRAKAGIGYVPQGREIFGQLTVEENLRLGFESIGSGPIPKRIPEDVLDMFPILRDFLKRRGGDLSGGQQQQLAIARALVSRPTLLLLDEPMEGIQPSIVQLIEEVIASIKAARKTSVLLVEQSLEFATAIADHYYVLDKGTVVASGSASELSADEVKMHLTV
ncbi:urea ABC transporter ATP-binding subunit UrtE [Paenibacillus thermoaerophilus]|uniref:Urea ABC transporter ATP-binding subunit UrtE n=1 Tax=Paenibacillus thermoaerophilus TaxID=1215385 RepID=A0ABW2V4W3_9BACL|nr:urea ABC transporter ATP-binding subunit UrtE [Paenibacillus thermoaerophilus]TMV18451.1 urea ABC transporter ATP-binding subunit UrtE [Paenibacillus thermoaerophilus]